MNWKLWLVTASLWGASVALACGDMCNSWGGGCGSLISSCSSPYDSAGFYGDSWSYGYTPSFDISINLDLSYLSGFSCGDSYTNYDMGCSIGYCSSSDGSSGYPGINPLDPWSLYSPTTFDFPGLLPGSTNPYLPGVYPFPEVPSTVLGFPGSGQPGMYPWQSPFSGLPTTPSYPYLPNYPSYTPSSQTPTIIPPAVVNPIATLPSPQVMVPQGTTLHAPNLIPTVVPTVGSQPGAGTPIVIPSTVGPSHNNFPVNNPQVGGSTQQVIPYDPTRGRITRGARPIK